MGQPEKIMPIESEMSTRFLKAVGPIVKAVWLATASGFREISNVHGVSCYASAALQAMLACDEIRKKLEETGNSILSNEFQKYEAECLDIEVIRKMGHPTEFLQDR